MHAQRLLALLLAVAASGCLQATPDLGRDNLAAPLPTVFHLLDPIKVGPGGDAETSIRLSKDGQTVLACSHGGFTQPSPVWASEDAGKTWRRIVPGPNPIISGDCDLAITDNGDWYVVFDTIASASVAVSTDRGKSWSFSYVAGPPVGGVDRPWLEPAGDAVYLTYADVMAAEPFLGFFTKTTDRGRTWAPPVLMGRLQSPDETNCFTGHPIVKDAGRTVRVPITCSNEITRMPPNSNTLYFLTSRDAGATWTREKVRGPDTIDLRVPSASYAPDGTLWLAFTTGTAANRITNAIVSRDDGKTWSEPLAVFERQADAFGWPWIDARGDGKATVVTLHNTKPQNDTRTGQWWQVTAARLALDPVLHVEGTADAMQPYVGASQTLEYINVRHAPDGRAYIVYPMAGDGCAAPPPGLEAQGRNRQCVFVAIEGLAS